MKLLNAVIVATVMFAIPLQAWSGADEKTRPPRIEDNLFLLEEAYNQEAGVVQHVQTFQYMKGNSFLYNFTQEWPVPDEKHQLSYTIPLTQTASEPSAFGISDIALNYRYQVTRTGPLAFTPRVSVLLPTGNSENGLGAGSVGYQGNLPLSIEAGDFWVTHWNAGLTYTPSSKATNGASANTLNFNYGAGLVWLYSETFNFLVEISGTSNESVEDDGSKTRNQSLLINPGFRFAINFESGLQVVPGLSFPIGAGPSGGDYGALAYLSFEHKLF